HMVNAAREAVSFAQGRAREDLDTDRMLVLALVQCLAIIGEAASRITAAFQQQHPQVPWADIIGMRNRLVHAYFDVNLDILWHTIQDDLPPLIAQMEAILAAEG
ncbi:MAG: HepT-like ribonuclease domain-containing protein, partial [Anaerolineae bacterium]